MKADMLRLRNLQPGWFLSRSRLKRLRIQFLKHTKGSNADAGSCIEQLGYLILSENIYEYYHLENLHSFKREQEILHTERCNI